MDTADVVEIVLLAVIIIALVAWSPVARSVILESLRSPTSDSTLAGGGAITARFKLIFSTVVVLAVLCLAVGAFLSLQKAPNAGTVTAAGTFLDLGKAGMGGIFGLIGGQSL